MAGETVRGWAALWGSEPTRNVVGELEGALGISAALYYFATFLSKKQKNDRWLWGVCHAVSSGPC